jgi:hypothetical protein
MRLAWDHSNDLFDWTHVAFDSFEGLPEIPPIDINPMWEKGKCATTEEELIAIVKSSGMPRKVETATDSSSNRRAHKPLDYGQRVL